MTHRYTLDRTFIRQLAHDSHVSQAARVMLLGLLRANDSGVALFEPDELGKLLRMPDEAARPAASVLKALEAAERLGYIVSGSPVSVSLDASKVRRVSE